LYGHVPAINGRPYDDVTSQCVMYRPAQRRRDAGRRATRPRQSPLPRRGQLHHAHRVPFFMDRHEFVGQVRQSQTIWYWRNDEIVNESYGAVAGALGTWRELVEDPPRIARPVYTWESDEG
jgi:hypothetical protein